MSNANDNPNPNANPNPKPNPITSIRCYTCQQLGHKSPDCPKSAVITRAEPANRVNPSLPSSTTSSSESKSSPATTTANPARHSSRPNFGQTSKFSDYVTSAKPKSNQPSISSRAIQVCDDESK